MRNVKKNSLKWTNKTIIDIEKHYKTESQILKHLNKSKQISPLIIVDPVQKQRNAAAALSKNSLIKFQTAAKKFLNNPNKKGSGGLSIWIMSQKFNALPLIFRINCCMFKHDYTNKGKYF